MESKRSVQGAEDPAQYIIAKVSPQPIVERFVPVLLFQHNESPASHGGAKKVLCFLAGSGTMVRLPDGQYCVLTSEHLFPDRREINYTCPRFMVRVLREKGDIITRSLVDAGPFFRASPGLTDVAVCMVTEGRDARIFPFSPLQGGGGEAETYSQFSTALGNPEDKIVRSLVSGQTANILFLMDVGVNHGGMSYFGTDYQSIAGESGTGFVDRQERLYVLKGCVSSNVGGLNAKLREVGATTEDKQGFSTLVGPISFTG